MVFRNWFNEQHSKQTSQKVKAVRKVCAESGKFLGTYPPYGYMKNPDNKHQLIIDENVAHIAKKIFEMRAKGKSYRSIALHLNELGVKNIFIIRFYVGIMLVAEKQLVPRIQSAKMI